MSWDGVNAVFEFAGGLFIWLNVFALYRDKRVQGVSPVATGFFWLWGCWGLAYYPAIGQHLSSIGAAFVCTANFVWLGMYIYYEKFYRKSGQAKSAQRCIGVGATYDDTQ